MKSVLKCIFLIFFIKFEIYAQKSGYVIYEKTSVLKTDSNEVQSESQKFVDKIFNAESSFDYKLIFSDQDAIFSIVKIPLDKKEINSESSFFAYGVMKTNTLKYINLVEQKVYSQDIDDSSFYTYTELSSYNWQITNESKMINGRLCFKAILSRKLSLPTREINQLITAWFCPDIPISLGPNGMGGLPGLILVLDSGGSAYVAKEIFFDEKVKVVKPKMKKVISEESYMKRVMANY